MYMLVMIVGTQKRSDVDKVLQFKCEKLQYHVSKFSSAVSFVRKPSNLIRATRKHFNADGTSLNFKLFITEISRLSHECSVGIVNKHT